MSIKNNKKVNLTFQNPLIKNLAKPFENDFSGNLKIFCSNLTKYLQTKAQKRPFVISVSATWGMGKTTLIDMWGQHLLNEGEWVIKYDTWRSDFNEYALMSVLATFNQQLSMFLESKKLKNIKNIGMQLVKNCIPIITKSSLSLVEFWLASIIPLPLEKIKKNITKIFEANIDNLLRKKMADHAKEEQAIQNFKEQVKIHLEESNKILFFFIDELDRCKPLYAVQVLEIIKHFFDIDRVCFIIASNTDCLFKTLKKVYGAEFTSEEYFERFIDRHISIPSIEKGKFITYKLKEFEKIAKFNASKANLIQIISACCDIFEFNLREIQKYMDQIEDFSDFNNDEKIPNVFMPAIVYLMALRRKDNKEFLKCIKTGDLSPVSQYSIINALSESEEQIFIWITKFLLASNSEENLLKEIKNFRRSLADLQDKKNQDNNDIILIKVFESLEKTFIGDSHSIYSYKATQFYSNEGEIEKYINYSEKTKQIFDFMKNFAGYS